MTRANLKRGERLFRRLALLCMCTLYAFSLKLVLSDYAATTWPQFGFSFREPDGADYFLLLTTFVLWAVAVPRRIDSASSLIIVIVYLLVCIPAAVVLMCSAQNHDGRYYGLLVSVSIGLFFTCMVTRHSRPLPERYVREVSQKFVVSIGVAWIVTLLFLSLAFGSVMELSSLDGIYAQRERGAASNLLEGYAQTYFGYVLSPALLVFGLINRNKSLIACGFLGALLLYAITAEKAAFTYPFLVSFLYFLIARRAHFLVSTPSIAFGFSLLLLISTYFRETSQFADALVWYVGTRSMLTPGAMVASYYEYFSDVGYTFLSHVSGFRFMIDAPAALVNDARWPSIGHLVGENYLDVPTLNANANFVASDGIAAFGALGAFFSFIPLTAMLVAFDRCADGIDVRFSIPVMLPVALTLTNGSLFTTLVSFGGLFWMMCMMFFWRYRQVLVASTLGSKPPPL